MARHATVTIPAATMTQLTADDATLITFVNKGSSAMLVFGTTDTTAPTDIALGIPYPPGAGEAGMTLASLFPGIAAVRVWAFSPYFAGSVMVSHD